jgi:phenylpropionate dioxygenase-like ring-hydroxylating dioxygenase large terminal subunit
MAEHIHSLPRVNRFSDRTIDAAVYTDPKVLMAETDRVFRRSWIAAAPSWRLRGPNRYATLSEAGIDVVVTRDSSGSLAAFQNRCLHRGSRLAHGCGKATELKCGYHGWVYGLEGHLQHAPEAEGFGGIDVTGMHLKPIAVREWAGLIWVNLSDEPADFIESLGGIASELEPYALSEMKPIEERVFTLPINWKTMLENAFDYYHVGEVHSRTVHAHVKTRPEMALYGDHVRQNVHIAPYAWRRLIDRRCSRGGPYTDKQMSQLYKYTLFPNTMLNVLPYHLTVMRFWPDGVGRTRLHYAFCRRKGARGVEWLRAHGTWLASRIILAEDVRMLMRCQTEPDAQAVPHHLLHDHEAASSHFHETMERWLQTSSSQ